MGKSAFSAEYANRRIVGNTQCERIIASISRSEERFLGVNWSFSFLFFPFLAFILASEEGNPFFGSMCLIRFALYKMAMNFGIFFFFCFVFSQLTGSILQPIPVRLPSNWNLVFEFDMIWPIPTTEDYKRKKKYKKYKRRQWMVKRRHRRELYATFEMALNRYEQVFRVFPASSTFLPRETCLPAKTCREESAR